MQSSYFNLKSIVFFILTMCIGCQSKPSHYLIGSWHMPFGNQDMIFKSDSTARWIFNDMVVPDTFDIKYRLDENKVPNQIDLYNFKIGILKGKALAGILEHVSPDTILLDFHPIESWAEADSARPKAFNPQNKRYLIKLP